MTFRNQELISEIEGLRRFACKLCRNFSDAEDLLQTTIMKALENKDKFQSGTDLFSWTSKIMFNSFASQYRRRVKFESQYDCEDLINNQFIEASQDKELEMSEVGDALRYLSPEHRAVLMMVTVHGLSYEEVADTIGIPLGTVRSRLSRARAQLKEYMTNGVPQLDNINIAARNADHKPHSKEKIKADQSSEKKEPSYKAVA